MPKMVRAGEYEAAVDQVRSSRWEARRGPARAYAQALSELGRFEEARAVLLRDFRRGRQLPSLIALARLELADGRGGVAALHFARVMALDPDVLDADEDVCELFRARARAHLAQDEAIAADQDLRRVFETCGVPKATGARAADLELAREIRGRATERARQLRALSPLPQRGAGERAAAREDFDRELERAAQGGPADLATFAAKAGARLTADEIVAVLLDEFESSTRAQLYPDAWLATWLGGRERAALLAELDLRVANLAVDQPAPAAWLQLRLIPFDARPRVGAPPSLASLRDQAMYMPADAPAEVRARAAARAWKVLARVGDYSAAELILARQLKALLKPDPASPARGPVAVSAAAPAAEIAPPAQLVSVSAGAPGSWWQRLDLDVVEHRMGLLALARLREARGLGLDALRMRAHALRGAPSTLVYAQARRELRLGRPYSALAISEEADAQTRAAVGVVAESFVEVAQVLCAGGCGLSKDRDQARAVMGTQWGGLQRAPSWPLPAQPGSTSDCPTGPTRVGAGITVGIDAPYESLVHNFESELTLGCAARGVVELLHAGMHEPSLHALRERLAWAPVDRSSQSLETRALLALATGHSEDAMRLAHAAAAESATPARVWTRIAQDGYTFGERDYEIQSRSRARMLTSGAAAREHEAAMARVRMMDANRDELLREGQAHSEAAYRSNWEDWLAHAPVRTRAHREAQMRALVSWEDGLSDFDARALELVDGLMWTPQPVAPSEGAALRGAGLDAPVEVTQAGDRGAQLRLEIGALVTGDAWQRLASAQRLLMDSRTDAASRARLVALLSRGGAAVEADASAAVPWFEDPGHAFRLAQGLAIDPVALLDLR